MQACDPLRHEKTPLRVDKDETTHVDGMHWKFPAEDGNERESQGLRKNPPAPSV